MKIICHSNFFYSNTVCRVNDCINNGLADKVVDPDGGVNVERKKAFAGLSHTSLNDVFPAEGFQNDLSILPKIRYSNMWK